MSTIQLAFLGPPQIYHDQQAIELSIAKMQGLLAYLLLTATPQPREAMLALFWAESHPEAARKNLRNRLWQLRQLVGDDLISTVGDRLALAPTVESDVMRFQVGLASQLQQPTPEIVVVDELLALWRGPLLADIQLTEAPEFELWLSQERTRLGRLYLQGIGALIAARRARNEWTAVVLLAERGLAHDPLDEALHQQLMTAYARQGLRAEALRQYERLQGLLASELGVDPLPETTALRVAIAAGEMHPQGHEMQHQNGQSVDHGSAQGVITPAAPQPTLAVVAQHMAQPFIGRQTELALLNRMALASAAGQSHVVLISGELGIGKTTLWQQWVPQIPLLDTLSPIVLSTRCLNTTQPLPFAPMRRLLISLPLRTEWSRALVALRPLWRAELLRLAPALQSLLEENSGSVPGEPLAAPQLSPNEERGLIAEAVTQFLRTAGARPLILIVDDLHWADSATLDWLLYLVDRMADAPLLLIGTYRPEDSTTMVNRLLAQWQREDLLQRIDLPHFTMSETVGLLTALGTDSAMSAYLHTQSGGNPYYLTQLSDVAIDGIPASLAELVRARLSYLDARWQPVLQAAAILEPTIDLALLTNAGDRSEEETVDAIDGLLAAAVLVEADGRYEFTHPLVATVMRETLSNGRRKLLHRRAAIALQQRYEQDQASEVAGQLAHHFAKAGQLAEAADFAEAAGAEALRIGAGDEAVAFYRQALTLWPTPARQLGLGMALMLLPGRIGEARQAMAAALAAYEVAGNCQGVIRAGLRLAASYLGTRKGRRCCIGPVASCPTWRQWPIPRSTPRRTI
ncbi:MAG: BTAD domain-containing putative transcriptional regulator [Caldilineaceae bacterium]